MLSRLVRKPVHRAIRKLLSAGRVFAESGSGVDEDAQAWADAVTLAGGTYSEDDLTAMDAFIVAAKSNGYWTKLTCFGPLYGADLAAALVQRRGGAWAPATNVNFVNGDYARATGLACGLTKHLDTGLLANTLTLNSTHMAFYNRASGTLGGELTMGAQDAGGNRLASSMPYADGNLYDDQYDASGGQGRLGPHAIAAPYGFVIGTRTASNLHSGYRNGVLLGSNTTTGGSLPALSMLIGAMNANGTPGSYFKNPCGMYSIGAGLAGAEAALYNTDIQALMTAAGRNV
jgi:hypothetical protein